MLTTNTAFDAIHALSHKWPLYLIHFDTEATDYVNHAPTSPDNTCKKYLVAISGLDQKKTPQEGKSSIGGIKFELLDVDDEITALLATDTSAYFQGRKVTVKAGYLGLSEANMLTICTNNKVHSLRLSKDAIGYIFEAADPMKKFQKILFRGADDSSVTLQGNAIDILLRVLTSSGNAGTNGDYDMLALVNGLNMNSTEVDITGIENMRDDYFPGNSHWMQIVVADKVKGVTFLEKEFFKPLNLTPAITNAGLFTVKPYKPPLANTGEVQTFSEDVIEGLPEMDFNLGELVNEVDFKYDHDGSDYTTIEYHQDSASITNRGQAKKAITIESKGLHTTVSGVSLNMFAPDITIRRAKSIFQRYAIPPIKIKFSTLFYRWLSEFGDIVPFTHSKLPDIVTGTRGYTSERMEVIQRGIDWKSGEIKFELLNTGFAKSFYSVISPTMTITAASSGTSWTVSAADAAKYANLTTPEVQLLDAGMRQQVAAKTITAINTTTGVCTSDDWGVTPTVGWIVAFADYSSCTDEQKKWGFIANSDDILGNDTSSGFLLKEDGGKILKEDGGGLLKDVKLDYARLIVP